MAKGKHTCKILKEIRKQIAAENDSELVVSECTYQGDCLGTCPKCEAEVRYLEHELEKRQRLGKAAVYAGMSIGTMLAASACGSTTDVANSNSNCTNGTEVTSDDSIHRPLAGDVVAITPENQDPDTLIIDNLMGIFPMFRANFTFDAEVYKNVLQKKFVSHNMENLTIVSGEMQYEHASMTEKACESLEELVEVAQEFNAPYYPDGEQKMLEDIAAQLKADTGKYKGDMEIAFSVTPWGELQNVEVVKGVNKSLDSAVVAVFEKMHWEPANYKLKGETWPFDCRCVQKIHFPIK